MFNEKKVIVVGMARSGIAAANALVKAGAIVTVNDSKTDIDQTELTGVSFDLGGAPTHLNYDMMVLSPGVPTDLEFIEEAKKKNIQILGALEVGFRLTKGHYYGITGTNGKTTTTTLTYNIFKTAGLDAHAVGNIGNALAGVMDSTEETHFVTEVSSFQLESTQDFHVHIAAILNIAPDHLNRHKTMENYIEAKSRIVNNQTGDDYIVLNYDDLGTRNLQLNTPAKKIYFSKSELEEGIFVKDNAIFAKFVDTVELLKLEDIRIPGTHNVENVLAAVSIAYLAGIELADIKKAVREFRGVEHRLEYVDTIEGVECYNDSKGTNPESSIVAVNSMINPTLLIAGGMDKGSEFESFVQTFPGKVKQLFLLGETKEIIKETAQKIGFEAITFVETMEEAVEKAFEIAEAGDALLLSPACASWDMYPSFEVRGEHFKTCLRKRSF